MAQSKIENYFNERKRTAVHELKNTRVKRILLSNEKDLQENCKQNYELSCAKDVESLSVPCHKIATKRKLVTSEVKPKESKITPSTSTKLKNGIRHQNRIEQYINNMHKIGDIHKNDTESDKLSVPSTFEEQCFSRVLDPTELLKTPPASPVKVPNAMDKIKLTGKELSYNQIKQKLSRSARLAELKASISKFQDLDAKLNVATKRVEQSSGPDSPSLKAFKSIELEVNVSPKKLFSPEKRYLSPKKDVAARKNLFSLLSPTKNAIAVPSSPVKQNVQQRISSLTLPYKYRSLADIFRSVDTICQILYNRKEIITFRKLKPAVESMTKRNFKELYLAQILNVYPSAYLIKQEKLRLFGTGMKTEEWELVIQPQINNAESFTAECMLDRSRKLFHLLIDRVKKCHDDFLRNLDPPMIIPIDKITRWHAEFDIEHVPDIVISELPKPPTEEKLTSGKDVLEKAKTLFNCNTRMEQALQRLQECQEKNVAIHTISEGNKIEILNPALKGIPKALLEKVRQKQAAKALESMTRPPDKEKELQKYLKLPEVARLVRNMYVAEKRNVLAIGAVVDKLLNSYRAFVTKTEVEELVKCLYTELPTWLMYYKVRTGIFLKMNKSADMNVILGKLDKLIKLKSIV